MKTIFIVDDDEMLSMMLTDHLSSNVQYIIHTFATGEECLQSLHLHPDIVVLDYNLNSINEHAANGLKILEEIKAFDPEILVVMYSSQEQYGRAVDIIGSLAIEYVLKDQKAFSKIENLIANA